MLTLLAGLAPQGFRPELPPLPPPPVREIDLSAAHLRHPIGEEWAAGLKVEGYDWCTGDRPALLVRCACGWSGKIAVRNVENALQAARVPRCPAPGGQGHLGPDGKQARLGRPSGRSPVRDEDERRILEAYDRISPTWPGTRRTLCLAVCEAAGLTIRPGYTGAQMRVWNALRSRRDGKV